MPKANLRLADGTKVTIEGSVEEVGTLLERFSDPSKAASKRSADSERRKKTKSTDSKSRRQGPQTLIAELAADGYFKKKRTITDVRQVLESRGHLYPVTSLSTPLVRLTRKKVLRRTKEDGQWVYTT